MGILTLLAPVAAKSGGRGIEIAILLALLALIILLLRYRNP
jgi:hypothetical protein